MNTSIYNKASELSLKEHIVFELRSLLWRTFFSKKPRLKKGKNFLQLWAWPNQFANWINADFFCFSCFLKQSNLHSDRMLDLRYPLKCSDNVWDWVYTEHTLEHLSPFHVRLLLKEVYRTLKAGSWLRIVVPDLEKSISYYIGKEVHSEFKKIGSWAEVMRNLTQNRLHRSVWDFELMKKLLLEIWFNSVLKKSYGVWDYKELIKDSKERAWESLYIEAKK